MESQVFGYFVSIGAGLSFGLSLGVVPSLLVWRWMARRAGHATKTQKARA